MREGGKVEGEGGEGAKRGRMNRLGWPEEGGREVEKRRCEIFVENFINICTTYQCVQLYETIVRRNFNKIFLQCFIL